MRWFASPHLPLALPPRVGRPCTCAMPHTRGGEMRESETRLRNARRACTCCPESDDTCAPVRVATSRVDPPPRVGRPCTQKACAKPHGEMRESATRLRNARRACTCCPESDDTCAPVRVATSRVDPPAMRWPTIMMHVRHAPHKGWRNARVRDSAPQRVPRLHMLSRVGRHLCAGPGRHISG